MGQKGILLGLVETMHFVHEQHRAAALSQANLGLLHRGTDILDPGQYCRKGNKRRIHCLGQNQGQGGFARAGRAPQNHVM